MASTWGTSWGTSWATSWGGEAQIAALFSGGWEPVRKRRSKKDIIEERRALGITVEPPPSAIPILQVLPSKIPTLRKKARIKYQTPEPVVQVDTAALSFAVQQAKLRRRQREEDELLLLF